MKKTIAATVLVALMSAACGSSTTNPAAPTPPSQPSPPPAMVTVQGRLTDNTSHGVLPNIPIYLDQQQVTVTDGQGHYTFTRSANTDSILNVGRVESYYGVIAPIRLMHDMVFDFMLYRCPSGVKSCGDKTYEMPSMPSGPTPTPIPPTPTPTPPVGTAVLVITGTNDSKAGVPCDGRSVGTPCPLLRFPPTAIGGGSNTLPLTLQNAGTGTLTITDIKLGGWLNDNRQFSVSPTSLTIAPGRTATVQVTFAPKFNSGFCLMETQLTFVGNQTGGDAVIGLSGVPTGSGCR